MRHAPRGGSRRRPDHVFFDTAELLFAVGGEDIGDTASGPLLDRRVGVENAAVESLGQPSPNGGLTGSRQSHQHCFRRHRDYPDARTSLAGSRSAPDRRYDSMLRRVSVSESPPNFSSAARASTSATIVSTTTPAAGTAQTSERWLIATASSPVVMSTVASARGTVEIGFIAARTRSGSPLVLPPSSPPARVVERTMPSGPGDISS